MKTTSTGIILSASATGAFICSYFMNLTLDNVEQYVALVSVLLVDGFFGVWAGAKREGFKTFKALKVLKSLFFWVLLLTAVLTIEKAFLGTEWLSETILILLAFNAMVEKHIELKSILRKMFLMDIYLALVLIRILDFQNI